MRNIIIAIIASTLATTVAITGLLFLPMLFQGDITDYGLTVGYIIILAYAASTLIGVIVIGLPAHFILRHFSITSISSYIAIGFIVPFTVIFILKPFGADPLPHLIQQGVVSGILSVICASSFWYYAVKPNKAINSDRKKRVALS